MNLRVFVLHTSASILDNMSSRVNIAFFVTDKTRSGSNRAESISLEIARAMSTPLFAEGGERAPPDRA